MNNDFAAAMRRAALSVRATNLTEATRMIRNALAGRPLPDECAPADPELTPPPKRQPPFPIDPDAEIIAPSALSQAAPEGSATASPRLRRPLGEALRILREGRLTAVGSYGAPGIDLTGTRLPGMAKPTPEIAVPEGAQFLARSFTCAAGTRRYRLYIPASAPDRPHGLLVMLHGCKQDPGDFAAGTGMNTVAETHGLLVAYPGQAGTDNASSCWNWFRPTDQVRDAGEPAIIAGITGEIMAEFGLDRSRVFVAGLSAGGAMAAIMGETYPDLFAAAGIHSGLACGAANDVLSAFSAMRGEAGIVPLTRSRAPAEGSPVRTIVFQGGADRTVHPSNAERIVTQVSPPGARNTVRRESARAPGGRTYTRTIVTDAAGTPIVEYWLIDGAGHAWSGGQAGGSYTDPPGPDASHEMVRFFLDQQ
ncbi:extracellular catalytic domain type 1 short-chain-length polyhydroxyalkanoate depolymerase [Pseudochelatococcus sp. B33]